MEEGEKGCTIEWGSVAVQFQYTENWIRFSIDYINLFFILGIGIYIALKG